LPKVAITVHPKSTTTEGKLMKQQAEEMLGKPIEAGSFILARGSSVRKGVAAAAAGLGSRTHPTPVYVDFGQVGFLAVASDEIAVFSGKQGLLKPKITGLVARIPRAAFVSFQLERGAMIVSGSISFDDGQSWEFEVPRARSGQIAEVETALAKNPQRS
jgi:hypothetical protein